MSRNSEQRLSEYLDDQINQRETAYALLLEQTGVAIEVIIDGSGAGWFTGYNGDLYAVEESSDEPELAAYKQFERWLVEHDSVVCDRQETPAFQELVE